MGIFLPMSPILVSLCLGTVLLSPLKKEVPLSWLLSGLLIGSITCLHALYKKDDQFSPPSHPVSIMARVERLFTYPGGRASIILKGVKVETTGIWQDIKGKILWHIRGQGTLPKPGQEIKGRLRLKEVHPLTNPGGFDLTSYYRIQDISLVSWSRGIPASIKVVGQAPLIWRIKEIMGERLSEVLSPFRHQGIISALLTGDRRKIPCREMELLQQAGISHIIAQSGMHIGFVALLGWLLAYLPSLIYPSLYLHIPRPRLGCMLAMCVVAIYFLISIPSPSLERAIIMFYSISLLFLLGHRGIILDALFLSLAILLLLDPFSPYQISFQLSYLALTGIILFAPPILGKIKEKAPHKVLTYLLSIIVISISANLLILPILIWRFGYISPCIYTNLIFIPAVAFLLMPLLLLGLSLIWLPSLAHYPFLISDHLLEKGFQILTLFKKHHLIYYFPIFRPHPVQLAGYYILLYGIYLFFKKQPYKKIIVTGLCCLLLPWGYISIRSTLYPTMRASILDVGQGEAIVLETSRGRTLIDGGGSWNKEFDFGRIVLSPLLCFMHPPRIKKIILTHGDIDHLGGLLFIIRHFSVGRFYFSGRWPPGERGRELKRVLSSRQIPVSILRAGDRLEVGDHLYLEILSPPSPYFFRRENDSSLVLRLVSVPPLSRERRGLFLITSDIEKKAISYLIERDISSEVIMVPHHGSKKSFDPRLYKKARAQIAVVSCGYKNRFGFPSKQVISFLNRLKTHLYSTSKNGCIEAIWRLPSLKLTIKTYRRN